MSESEQIMVLWKIFFYELLNKCKEEKEIDHIIPDNEEPVDQPTEQEIINAIEEMKNNIRRGANGITAEILKVGGGNLYKKIIYLVEFIRNT